MGYQNEYVKTRSIWQEYYKVIDLIRKRALRIREEVHGLRNLPLSSEDLELKNTIEQSFFLLGITWKDFGIKWHLSHEGLIQKIRAGEKKENLLKAIYWKPVIKKTTK